MAHKDSQLARRLGAAMRTLRERTGLSQAEVARRMDLNPSAQTQLGRYERGERIPRADTLQRFLDAVEARFADLESCLGASPQSARRKLSRRVKRLTRELSEIGRRKYT